MAEILVLDAMGLYEAGDDVAELLVPFVGRHGRADLLAEAIDRDYVEASLGRMDTDAFWRRIIAAPSTPCSSANASSSGGFLILSSWRFMGLQSEVGG